MITELTASDFYIQSVQHLTIDVRSEAEYNHAHIPHALNLPLFNNEERAVIGTIYKQQGRRDAIEKGLQIVGPKMSHIVQFVKEKIRGNKVFVHCWRGGMRSGSVAWLLNLLGWQVYTLKGGYKSYRNLVLEVIAAPRNFAVIGGYTGSGKSKVLHLLASIGEQVIDLELLSNHKGSAFGALGNDTQPSTEMFENLLHQNLVDLNNDKCVWIEDESKTIGTVYLHQGLWSQIRAAQLYLIEIPFELRVQMLVNDYGKFPTSLLESAISKIRKRLGDENCREAIAALHSNDLTKAVSIVLRYYDKAYQFGLEKRNAAFINKLLFNDFDAQNIASTLINLKPLPTTLNT